MVDIEEFSRPKLKGDAEAKMREWLVFYGSATRQRLAEIAGVTPEQAREILQPPTFFCRMDGRYQLLR